MAVEVSDILRDTNILRVEFFSPLIYDSLQSAAYPFRLPDKRAFSRKAPYQYGGTGERSWYYWYLEKCVSEDRG